MIERLKQLESFDLVKHEVILSDKKIYMMFLSSLTSSESISILIEGFLFSENKDPICFFNGSSSKINDYEQAVFLLLSGQCLVIVEDEIYAIETRSYPNRSIEHPNIEKSIRGSHDSFTENILLNVGLIRRRIRSDLLKIEIQQEGKLMKTDIAICFMDNKVDYSLLHDLKRRIKDNKKIEINNERNLCEVLYGKTLNPYPHVRYSERPDICSIHLLQGNIVILVDNMPSSMILPTTFFEQIQQIEEYTQTPMIAFMTRFIRLSGIFMSLYILPFILICIFENKWVESSIEIDSIAFLTFQILICELLIEWIRQSLLYAPNLINSILGFIVAFVLGDFGIDLGAYSKDILLLVALSNLGNFLTPSYEIALANKFMRIFMTLMTIFFKLPGFIIGVMIHLYLLCTTKTLKHPYLYPLIPFDLKEMKRLLFDTNIYTK